MDNDKKIIKKFRQIVKQIKFRFDYRDINVLPEEQGNKEIHKMILEGNPGFVARGGATEMRCIDEYLAKGTFSERIKYEITNLSGVFPNDTKTLSSFCELYMQMFSQADIVALWGVGAEAKVIHQKCSDAIFTELHALEPYYFTEPWTGALKGKNVLVVHPFKDSIVSQYKRREKLFSNCDVLPEFKELTCIKAVQSIAGQPTAFESWFSALKYMKDQIDNVDFDVALIGAGAYGLPLAAHCKEIGKQAIQMSGATQLLFGIKGKRWDTHPVISKFYNDYWIRPARSETPAENRIVEGGSYW